MSSFEVVSLDRNAATLVLSAAPGIRNRRRSGKVCNRITVRVDLFKRDGTPLTATLNSESEKQLHGMTIPAGGVITLSPRDTNGDSRS